MIEDDTPGGRRGPDQGTPLPDADPLRSNYRRIDPKKCWWPIPKT